MGIRRICMALGVLLGLSVFVTLSLLLFEGRWQEAIPLHLCSLSALCAIALAFCPCREALGFLWYLGMPGALAALLFPAPAVSCVQPLMDISFAATHLLILLIPVLRMLGGMPPPQGRGISAFLLLQVFAVCACGVNRLLGTNFLFLSAPPLGTPLVCLHALGEGAYLIALETLVLLVCLGMDSLSVRLSLRRDGIPDA